MFRYLGSKSKLRWTPLSGVMTARVEGQFAREYGRRREALSEQRAAELGEADIRRLIRQETAGRGQLPAERASIADPMPVALAGFALTTFLFSIINAPAGWSR